MADHPSRRNILAGAAAFTAWAAIPKIAVAGAGRDPRFVTIILRGGLDGLAAVAPVGDRHYEEVRDRYAMPVSGERAGFVLDGFFTLNQRLSTLASLYEAGEALFVHAAHTPYRERSHFEAQDMLENGTTSKTHHVDGWMGRALATLPLETRLTRGSSFAAASSTPLILRGTDNVVTWLPPGFPSASADTRARLMSLYEHTDPVLAAALADGLNLETMAGSEAEIAAGVEEGMMGMGMEMRGGDRQVVAAATAAGRALASDAGARIGFLDLSGFDTHRGQRLVDGSLGRTLIRLDRAIQALRNALGPVWNDTVVAILTEFGRTVRFNGSQGTDHGSGTVAIFIGGAVKGGRVIADWPGLAEGDLFDNRDLMATTDLRGVLKGMMRDHMGFERKVLAETVFPGTADVRPMDGLIRG